MFRLSSLLLALTVIALLAQAPTAFANKGYGHDSTSITAFAHGYQILAKNKDKNTGTMPDYPPDTDDPDGTDSGSGGHDSGPDSTDDGGGCGGSGGGDWGGGPDGSGSGVDF
ncbi:MAG: hypothetical protein OZSIB_0069 [Candidatus Ozemobacter sibiricus]|uniref:Uncharacterized protein n=1 Tax=Candidatus Ozemobacter sibiricus TaxID=2268124 RepID=A0A367ZNU4_9BACT|nr:MAG: hypothetical protein OZSIB_0069 [Candidatus Ozemobacter sibiricus]